jgi:hypothetical protein
MPHPLEAGTIRILRPDGSTAGTGFLVSKQLAITCAHVVDSARAKPGAVIEFKYHLGESNVQEAKVLENGWSSENDVAVLELTEKPPKWIRPIIMQSSRAMEGRSFQGLGYPDDGPVQTRWPQGNISGRVEVKGYLNPLLQIQGKEIDKGLSGSAVVDRTTRRVVGMLSAYQDIARPSAAEKVRFGYAVPIETVWNVYPELEKELPPLPRRSPLVEGIHLLPHGYDFRIQNFVSEYLGTPEQPEPFGGREDALRTLDDWLEGDTQHLLLAAPAGRGKSALLVRWMDRLLSREDLALVFVPVSVRFRTNLASAFFASLAARLAYLHGEDVPIGVETSTDVWCGLAATYLTKPLTDDRKLLVVLDGLDEAGDWEASADLIPAELPNNVRVVVSARFLAGDADARPWLSRLGWEHRGKTSTLDLAPLDTSGVADVLLRMGVALDELSRRADVVAELHRLSQGDPLLVNLYVEDLWSRGEQASRLRPEDLQNIRPGYEGYFDRWWADQKKLWGKESPLHEKSVQLVFNLLCCALGGLTKDDLLALDSGNELNSFVIEDALDALKRFVIGILPEHREKEVSYVLSHPKLRDYFMGKLTETERTGLEGRFIDWGERTMQALIEGKRKPIETPHYLLQYFGVHLERSDAPLQKFLPFTRHSGWHRAWFAYEGAYGGYMLDVSRIWKLCSDINRQEIQEAKRPTMLGEELRCALISSTLHSLSARISPDLLVQLVGKQLCTLPQALAYIRQMPDAGNQSRSIAKLMPYLSDGECAELLKVARQIGHKRNRLFATSILASRLPEAAREALEIMPTIKNKNNYFIGLGILAISLPKDNLGDVLAMAKETLDESLYARIASLNDQDALESNQADINPGTDQTDGIIDSLEASLRIGDKKSYSKFMKTLAQSSTTNAGGAARGEKKQKAKVVFHISANEILLWVYKKMGLQDFESLVEQPWEEEDLKQKKFQLDLYDAGELLSSMVAGLSREEAEKLLSLLQDTPGIAPAYILSSLAQNYPKVVGKAFTEISEIFIEEEVRVRLLGELVNPLIGASPPDSYSWFSHSLSVLASRNRQTLISDLEALLPFLLQLGPDSIAQEIYAAVKDITTWWP